MNVANNILKHNLQNVYFLTGTALAGKTTMTKELSNKYGFVPFHDNHNEPHFKVWEKIRSDKSNSNIEYVEFVIIELIKLAQNNKVVADACIPFDLLKEISDYNRIACMLALPELVNCENYGNRDDHRDWLEWIMSQKDYEIKIKQENELFRAQTEQTIKEAEKSKLFSIIRTNESTVENTLKILEKHFGL
jgi:adenylate kinase family enzyme